MPDITDDAPTQSIQASAATQAIPRLPAGLDPARSSDTGRVNDDATEVMSLDELMDLASTPRPAVPAAPAAPAASVAPGYPPTPQPRPTDAPRAGSGGPPLREEIGKDLREITEKARDWLTTGDNGLIAATAFIALLLIVIVAAL